MRGFAGGPDMSAGGAGTVIMQPTVGMVGPPPGHPGSHQCRLRHGVFGCGARARPSTWSLKRKLSTLYHLAHGLLDHAQHLTSLRHADAAANAIGEASDIASRLRCLPLLDRADAIEHARPRVTGPVT